MKDKQIDFKNFSGYLNNLYYYGGYGGMNWNDMYEVQAAFVNEHNWCDTGYNNVLSGKGEGITLGDGGFQSDNLGRSFTLMKGTFASAWESNQPVDFNTYTYTAGQGFTLKASVDIALNQNAKTINFAHYGADFKDISMIAFVSGVGQGGNTCSYGTPTYGYILVMDNLEYHWDGAGKSLGAHPGNMAHRAPHHVMPHIAANFSPLSAHGDQDTSGQPASHTTGAHDVPYHTQLSALPGHDSGGLTGQFALPQAEHFGT